MNSDLTLTSGTLIDSSNSIYLLNNVNNNAVHVSTNAATGGMVFIGTSNQGMTGSGSGVFGNIEINNSGHGVNMTDNSTINGQIKFTSGALYIDDYALTLGQTVTIAGTVNISNLILLNGVLSDKGVTKIFPAGASSFTFPIGDNGKYTPCTFNFSSNSNSSGAAIKVIPVASLHPSINPAGYTDYLNYYWNVSTTGFSSAYTVTHTYTYVPADVKGIPAYIQQYNNSTALWSTVAGTISFPTFYFTSSSLLDGSYTIGDQFASLPTLTSNGSGNWNTAASWLPANVPNGNPVVIRSTDSIALSANGANAASVTINGVLDAVNTTFHNIGQVSGGGKIRLLNTSSGMFVFPAGTYDAFLANPAGTIEFYGSTNGTLPLDPGNATKPYQNVLFSGTGIKYISSVDMVVNGNLTLSNGSKLDNTLYNRNVIILGNWTDNNASTTGFNGGTGTVTFSGSAAQKIVMANNSMTEIFYNLGINNAAGLTLQTGKAGVANQLILTLGNINTSSTDSLTITNTSSGAVAGGSVNSFVNGPLSKLITNGSNFQFPVGDAVSSARNRIGYVSVNSTATTGTQIWTSQYFDKNPSAGSYDVTKVTSPLSSVSQNEYWNIVGPTGGSANVVLTWDSASGMNSSPAKRALSKVAEWNTPVSASWNSVGAVVTDNGQYSGTVATSTPVTLGNNIFTIGATSASLITAIQSGLWNVSTTWNGGGVPGLNDTVEIGAYTVTLNSSAAIAKFILDPTGTLYDSTNTITVSGNFIFNGTVTGSGKISLGTSSDTIFGTGTTTGKSVLEIAGGSKFIASTANLTFKNVSILAGDTLDNLGSITVDTIFGAASTSIFNNLMGSTLTINGPLLSTGTFNGASYCPNIVIYNGTVAQTIDPVTYCTLKLNNSGVKTAAGSFNVNNDLYINPGSNLSVGSGVTIQVLGRSYTAGALTNNGNILISN